VGKKQKDFQFLFPRKERAGSNKNIYLLVCGEKSMRSWEKGSSGGGYTGGPTFRKDGWTRRKKGGEGYVSKKIKKKSSMEESRPEKGGRKSRAL